MSLTKYKLIISAYFFVVLTIFIWLLFPLIDGYAVSSSSLLVGVFGGTFGAAIMPFTLGWYLKRRIKRVRSKLLQKDSNINIQYITGANLLVMDKKTTVGGNIAITANGIFFVPDSSRKKLYELKIPFTQIKKVERHISSIPILWANAIKITLLDGSCSAVNLVYDNPNTVMEKINNAMR